jgi:single-strand DNA-binding protein
MSGCVNKVILVGNLGKDPAMKDGKDGKIARFSLALNRQWRDKDSGERKQNTTWVNVVVFNKGLAEVAEKYLKKGASCYLEGEISVRQYTGDDNVERWVTEIVLPPYGGTLVLLDRREGNRPPDEDDYSRQGQTSGSVAAKEPEKASPRTAVTDEVPF